MASFNTIIAESKKAVREWADCALLNEATIIRDVAGNVSLLLNGSDAITPQSIDALRGALTKRVAPFRLSKLYWEPDKNKPDIETAIIRKVKELRYDDGFEGVCHWYRVERTVAKKAWLDCTHTTPAIWERADAKNGLMPKVVTFYSFKGGMGRTTALAAVSLILARSGKNVLVIDTDIEAPGLASLFFAEEENSNGTVDYFLEPSVANGKAADIKRYYKHISDDTGNSVLIEGIQGNIFIVPAGFVNSEYIQKLSRIDYQDTQPGNMRSNIVSLVNGVLKHIARAHKCNIDYVFFDARSGFNDMSGVITAQLPHGVVLFGKDTTQSWNGLRQVVSAIANVQNEALPVAIINSMCPETESTNRKSFLSQSYTIFCEEYYPQTGQGVPSIDSFLAPHAPLYIPYNEAFNRRFELFSDGSADGAARVAQAKSHLLQNSYLAIASRICGWFEDSIDS